MIQYKKLLSGMDCRGEVRILIFWGFSSHATEYGLSTLRNQSEKAPSYTPARNILKIGQEAHKKVKKAKQKNI